MSDPVDTNLRKDIEDAILEVADRHPNLRGPWVFNDVELQEMAARIRTRRAALSPSGTPAGAGGPFEKLPPTGGVNIRSGSEG